MARMCRQHSAQTPSALFRFQSRQISHERSRRCTTASVVHVSINERTQLSKTACRSPVARNAHADQAYLELQGVQEYSVSPSTPLPLPENIWVAGKFSWCCKDSGAAALLDCISSIHSTDGMTVPA